MSTLGLTLARRRLRWLRQLEGPHAGNIVLHFVERGAEVNPRNTVGWTPLTSAIQHDRHPAIENIARHGGVEWQLTNIKHAGALCPPFRTPVA